MLYESIINVCQGCTPCRQRRGKANPPLSSVSVARCTPCRQRRGKGNYAVDAKLAAQMHPVQAAPRQRSKPPLSSVSVAMHPVQAAPRQRHVTTRTTQASRDAPRAGSAEAKAKDELSVVAYLRCTPCRQRRGKVKGLTGRRGKGGCTPCRQRRGKELCRQLDIGVCAMHPVQAAPRQRYVHQHPEHRGGMHPVQAAPRQRQRRRSCSTNRRDAPRAGSAEAKTCALRSLMSMAVMHPVQAAPRQR